MLSISHPRTSLVALAVSGCLAAAVAVTSACLTDPPADLPPQSALGPVIVHTALSPPEGLLQAWPSEFVVPVRNVDPNNCSFSAIVGGQLLCQPQQCGGVFDGRVLLIDLNNLRNTLDPTICGQTITFNVATKFLNGCQTYDDGQGDTAQWEYYPPSCLIYDAGAVQDGAFPEAASDGLPLVPESGVDP